MKQIGVIRPRKDGNGCSMCTALDENVGKRRCVHTFDSASMVVHRVKGMNIVDIEDSDVSVSIKANEAKVREYITELSNGLDSKVKENLLNALRNR